MKKNLYVISGVTGMTGSELAGQLIKKGEYVIGFDNLFASSEEAISDIKENLRFSYFQYDLNDIENMKVIKELVEVKKVDCNKLIYINCAAVVHTEYFYDIESTYPTNVRGMKSFLEQAIEVNADYFINCSTSEVYSMRSWNEEGGIREKDFLLMADVEHTQRTSYAVGKLLTEFFMKDAVDKNKIKGCSVRFANVYSKKERFNKHIIPHIIEGLKSKGEVTLLENARENRRTFLHNIDSCRAVLALLENEDALDGTVYNVSTEEEISIIDLVHLIAGKLNISNPKIKFDGYRSGDPVRRILNIDKIKERTSWRPMISLSEGISMCLKEIV